MTVPPLGVVALLVGAMQARGMAPAVGGSGLLVALGLATTAHDWDVTVDAPDEVVVRALHDSGLSFRNQTDRGGIYATEQRYIIDGTDHAIDLLVGFALHGPDGVEHLPTRVRGRWSGLPLADPVVWARAYRLLGRTAKADALERWVAAQSQ